MRTNLEQITDLIRALPLEDLEKLEKLIDEEKQAKREKNNDLQKELKDYAKAKKSGLPKTAKNI